MGVGTTFTVTIPVEISGLIGKSEKKIKLNNSRTLMAPKYRKILVAEDNAVNQKVVVTFLKKLQFESDVAVNGNEAIKLIQKNKYDIVLMDCQMVIQLKILFKTDNLSSQNATDLRRQRGLENLIKK